MTNGVLEEETDQKKVKYKNTPDKKSHMVGYTTIILIYYSFKDNLAWIYTSGKITS